MLIFDWLECSHCWGASSDWLDKVSGRLAGSHSSWVWKGSNIRKRHCCWLGCCWWPDSNSLPSPLSFINSQFPTKLHQTNKSQRGRAGGSGQYKSPDVTLTDWSLPCLYSWHHIAFQPRTNQHGATASVRIILSHALMRTRLHCLLLTW